MEQPLATQSNDLTADTNCTINYVEIIHDCEPRRAPLELQIVPQDRKLYLKVMVESMLTPCMQWYNGLCTTSNIINSNRYQLSITFLSLHDHFFL